MSNPFNFMNRRGFLNASLLGIFANSYIGKAIAALPVTAKILGKPTSNSFTNAISATSAARAYIEYGYSKSTIAGKTSIISIPKGATRNITVTNLKSASLVYYRVKYAVGTTLNFASLPQMSVKTTNFEENSSTTFAIQADPHMDENSSADVYEATLKQIVAASPAFLMDLGDIFMVDKLPSKTEANIRRRFELMKGYYQKLGSVPLKICLGNHDGELGYSSFNTKKYRKEYFPAQTPDLAYYSFTSPNALHVVLDIFTYTTTNPKDDGWQWTLGKTQYDWLKATLESSKAPHKFIYVHHLLYGNAQSRGGSENAKYNEWGGLNRDGTEGFATNRPGWDLPVHQLLVKNGVDFVFKGHDHIYVKQELDGIIYQTLPQPSHPGEKTSSAAEYGYVAGKTIGGSGFLKLTTTSSSIKVDFVKHDGTILDSYVKSA